MGTVDSWLLWQPYRRLMLRYILRSIITQAVLVSDQTILTLTCIDVLM